MLKKRYNGRRRFLPTSRETGPMSSPLTFWSQSPGTYYCKYIAADVYIHMYHILIDRIKLNTTKTNCNLESGGLLTPFSTDNSRTMSCPGISQTLFSRTIRWRIVLEILLLEGFGRLWLLFPGIGLVSFHSTTASNTQNPSLPAIVLSLFSLLVHTHCIIHQ